MSAHDPDIINAHNEGFTQGESFGRHVARQELLPLLKAVSRLLTSTVHGPHTVAGTDLDRAIADIETT
tara:strand:+ start:4751 stop:4954 length:204 start_codon:yes stop_codon:yes gene_type:complete